MVKQKTVQIQQQVRDTSWLKGLLNNMPLLKWVKKYSADNLLTDTKLAGGYGIKSNEESVSISDSTMTKILTTDSRFSGKELVRFNMKQLAEVIHNICKEGELIISDTKNKEMVVQSGSTTIVICPLPNDDKSTE